jgi:hypothetical protein
MLGDVHEDPIMMELLKHEMSVAQALRTAPPAPRSSAQPTQPAAQDAAAARLARVASSATPVSPEVAAAAGTPPLSGYVGGLPPHAGASASMVAPLPVMHKARPACSPGDSEGSVFTAGSRTTSCTMTSSHSMPAGACADKAAGAAGAGAGCYYVTFTDPHGKQQQVLVQPAAGAGTATMMPAAGQAAPMHAAQRQQQQQAQPQQAAYPVLAGRCDLPRHATHQQQQQLEPAAGRTPAQLAALAMPPPRPVPGKQAAAAAAAALAVPQDNVAVAAAITGLIGSDDEDDHDWGFDVADFDALDMMVL